MRAKFLALSLIAGTAVMTPAIAHHSYAMFDMTKQLTLTGVVKEYQWTNPHTWVQLTVSANGKIEDWSLEGGSPNMLVRKGWGPNIIKPGDTITVEINPLKDGTNGGEYTSVTTTSGAVYKVK